MRVRIPVGRAAFFLAVFVFALVALFPLRIAIDYMGLTDHGLAARKAEGSIWTGALGDAQFAAVPLGDLRAELSTLPLFLGRARVSLGSDAPGTHFDGAATVAGDSFGFDDLEAQLAVGPLFAPLPVSGLDLSGVTVRFEAGQCSEAEGLVRANIAGDVGGILLPGGLSGTARCDQNGLLLPLASQSGMERLDLRIFADGRYRTDLTIRPVDDSVRDRLLAAGFNLTDNGYALTTEGVFRQGM